MGGLNATPVTNYGASIGQNNFDILPYLLAGLGGAAGGFGTPTTQNGTTTQNSSTNGTSNFSQNLQTLLKSLSTVTGSTTQNGTQSGTSTNAYADPANQALSQKLAAAFSNLTTPDLKGYQGQQTEQINHNSQLLGQGQQEALAARGLSTSPVAGSVAATNEGNRVGQISNLQASIPLLSNQLALSNLGAANSFLASAPKTTTSSGTSSQVGSSSQVGDTTQTGYQSGGGGTTTSGTSSGTSTNQSSQKAGGGAGGVFGGLGSILAALFG